MRDTNLAPKLYGALAICIFLCIQCASRPYKSGSLLRGTRDEIWFITPGKPAPNHTGIIRLWVTSYALIGNSEPNLALELKAVNGRLVQLTEYDYETKKAKGSCRSEAAKPGEADPALEVCLRSPHIPSPENVAELGQTLSVTYDQVKAEAALAARKCGQTEVVFSDGSFSCKR